MFRHHTSTDTLNEYVIDKYHGIKNKIPIKRFSKKK